MRAGEIRGFKEGSGLAPRQLMGAGASPLPGRRGEGVFRKALLANFSVESDSWDRRPEGGLILPTPSLSQNGANTNSANSASHIYEMHP